MQHRPSAQWAAALIQGRDQPTRPRRQNPRLTRGKEEEGKEEERLRPTLLLKPVQVEPGDINENRIGLFKSEELTGTGGFWQLPVQWLVDWWTGWCQRTVWQVGQKLQTLAPLQFHPLQESENNVVTAAYKCNNNWCPHLFLKFKINYILKSVYYRWMCMCRLLTCELLFLIAMVDTQRNFPRCLRPSRVLGAGLWHSNSVCSWDLWRDLCMWTGRIPNGI